MRTMSAALGLGLAVSALIGMGAPSATATSAASVLRQPASAKCSTSSWSTAGKRYTTHSSAPGTKPHPSLINYAPSGHICFDRLTFKLKTNGRTFTGYRVEYARNFTHPTLKIIILAAPGSIVGGTKFQPQWPTLRYAWYGGPVDEGAEFFAELGGKKKLPFRVMYGSGAKSIIVDIAHK